MMSAERSNRPEKVKQAAGIELRARGKEKNVYSNPRGGQRYPHRQVYDFSRARCYRSRPKINASLLGNGTCKRRLAAVTQPRPDGYFEEELNVSHRARHLALSRVSEDIFLDTAPTV
jgi:hypothetical protein